MANENINVNLCSNKEVVSFLGISNSDWNIEILYDFNTSMLSYLT